MPGLLQGAFSVAVKAGVPIVPITLIGTGKLMPNGQEGKLYSGDSVRIIVHPQVPPPGPCRTWRSATRLRVKCVG